MHTRRVRNLDQVLLSLFLASFCAVSAQADTGVEKAAESSAMPAENAVEPTTTTESSSAASEDGAVKSPQHKLFMWKATKGNQSVYFLGTIHVARPEFYPLPAQIDTAMNVSDTLIVELALDRIDKTDLQKLVHNQAAYPPGDCLEKHLSQKTKDALNSYLAWAGESMAMYNDYRPWMVKILLESAALKREGFGGDLGIDQYLLNKAKKRGKKVLELETSASQVKVLSSSSDEDQDKMLLLSLTGLKKLSETIQLYEKAWKTGDEAIFNKAVEESAKNDNLESFRKELIDKRNIAMAAKLDELTKGQNNVVVAVGAAHLIGSYGLPALMKAKGYEVEQVAATGPMAAMPSVSGRANKMQTLFYPEGLFSVSLPGNPSVKYANVAGMRSVDYTYPEFSGIYQVSYLVFPQAINSPAIQNKMYDAIAADLVKKTKGTLIRSYSTTQQGRPAKQIDIKTGTTTAVGSKPQSVMMRLKLVAAGKRFYIIGGTGTAAWLSSPAVNNFINSLSIRGETTAMQRQQQSQKSKSDDFHRDFEARRKEFDRKFAESQSNARKSFEGARAQHERMWGK